MRGIFFAFVIVAILLFACKNKTSVKPNIDGKIFTGKWIYRSFLNSKDVNTDFDNLEFAAATIQLRCFNTDSIMGQILWAVDSTSSKFNGLNLKGKYFYNDTTLCYFIEGFGDSTLGTAQWQYNYQGYVVPHWLNSIDQATALVGSVVRVKKHSCDTTGKNCKPAGLVASTYMVKD